MNIPLKETDLPYTFCTFKGNIHWTFHNYLDFLILSTDSNMDVSDFVHEYRAKQRDTKHSVQHALPGPLRVIRGSPVLVRWRDCQVYFNEETDNLCTYNTDKGCRVMYVILDESRTPSCICSGLYKASVKVKTRPEFWNQQSRKKESPYAEFANIQAEIYVTLEEYIEPFKTTLEFQETAAKRKEALAHQMEAYQPKKFPSTFSEFLKDFRGAFGF